MAMSNMESKSASEPLTTKTIHHLSTKNPKKANRRLVSKPPVASFSHLTMKSSIKGYGARVEIIPSSLAPIPSLFHNHQRFGEDFAICYEAIDILSTGKLRSI